MVTRKTMIYTYKMSSGVYRNRTDERAGVCDLCWGNNFQKTTQGNELIDSKCQMGYTH